MSLSYKKALKKIECLDKGTPLLIRDANPFHVMYSKDLYATRTPESFSFSVQNGNFMIDCDKTGSEGYAPMMQINWNVINGLYMPNYSKVGEKIKISGYPSGYPSTLQNKLDVLAGEEEISKFIASIRTYEHIESPVKHFLGIKNMNKR